MDNLTPKRRLLIPADVRGTEKIMDPQGTNLTIIVWDGPNMPGAVLFEGKSDKPLWRYSFKSTAARDKKIEESIEVAKVVMQRNQERRRQRSEFQHSLKLGDILVASWGYDQTNVDFYEVTKLLDKAVVVRHIEKKSAGRSGTVMPVPGSYDGPPLTKIPQIGDVVKIDESIRAYKWDGKPEFQTPAGFGH